MSSRAVTATVFCLVVILLCVGLINNVRAQESSGLVVATLSWEPPTERENGDPLPVEEISHFDIEVREPGNDSPSMIRKDKKDGELPTTHRHGIRYSYGPEAVERVYRIRTVDEAGLASDWSEPVTYRAVVAPSDSAPGQVLNFSIGVECEDCALLERQ